MWHYTRNDDGSLGSPSADQTKALRKNYAGIGFTYDVDNDAFIPPQPYDSWTMNNTTYLWEAPIPYPTDGLSYEWDENAYQSDTADPKTQGWVEIT